MTSAGGGPPPRGLIISSQWCISEMPANKTELFVCSSDECRIGGHCRSAYGQRREAAGTGKSNQRQLLTGPCVTCCRPQQVNFIISPLFHATGGETRAPRSTVRCERLPFQRTPDIIALSFQEGAHQGGSISEKVEGIKRKKKHLALEGR